MEYRYRYLPEERVCLVRYQGSFSAERLVAADTAVFEETKGFGVRILFDMRDVELDGRPATVREYRTWMQSLDLAQTHPGLRQAIIVSRPRETGLALLLASTSGVEYGFEVFSTVEGACQALGIPLETIAAHADVIPP